MRLILLVLPALLVSLSACERHEAPVPPAAGDSATKPVTYTPAAQPPAPGGNCALDAIAGAPPAGAKVKLGTAPVFAGWLGNADQLVPEQAQLILTGSDSAYAFDIRAGDARPDVATALSAPGLAASGYNSQLAFEGVTPGSYALSIVTPGSAVVECNLNVTIQVE